MKRVAYLLKGTLRSSMDTESVVCFITHELQTDQQRMFVLEVLLVERSDQAEARLATIISSSYISSK